MIGLGEPRSILVRGPNWTGDLVMSTPGFRALRAAHPDARIVLQVRGDLEPLVHGSPWFDAVAPLDAGARSVRAIWREGRALRRQYGRFELGLCIPDSFSSALLMRAAGVRRVVGYRRSGRGWLLHHPVAAPASWGPRRMVAREEFVLRLMAAVGCTERGTQLELFTTEQEEARADGLLREWGLEAGQPWAALAPGASYGRSKQWPAQGFAQVADTLARSGVPVAILGTADERPLAAAIQSWMRERAADLTGRSDLGSVKALLRRASLLVCNDAGARHIAAAFGVPTLLMLGPTSLEKTALNLERVVVMKNDVPCRPCYLRVCPIDHRCMTGIDPEVVAEKALESLGRTSAVTA